LDAAQDIIAFLQEVSAERIEPLERFELLKCEDKPMGRLPEIDETKLPSDQRRIYDELKRARGHVRGPFAVWLRNVELCENTLKLQEMFASRVKLERRLLELMILVSARLATAQYAWFIHEPHALRFGIAPHIIQAIRERRTPEFSDEDECLVYDITIELNTTRSLSETNYQRGMALFGEQAMVELVSAIGFYAMVAMTLNAFAIPAPGSKQPLV
jgi:4-carboxymuconolactone decarboxylase